MIERQTGPEFNIDQVQREFERAKPVLQVIAERRENGDYWEKKSIYDRFMCDYVGDPWIAEKDGIPQHSEIRRTHRGYGEVNYDQRYMASYTQEGHLVHVRKSAALSGDKPEAYFAVTADMESGEVTEWRVSDVEFDMSRRPGSTDMLVQKLVLSKRFLRGLDAEPEIDSSEIDPIKAVTGLWKRRAAYEVQQQASPSIELTAQGCWLNLPGNNREELAPITDLHAKLLVYEKHYKEQHDEYMQLARSLMGKVALLPLGTDIAPAEKPAKKERSFILANKRT